MTRMYLREEEAIEKDWYSRKDLKELFRLKPAPDQEPAGTVWQGMGTYLVYDKEKCVAMRPYRKPSAKQLAALAAGRDCIGTRPCATENCNGRVYYGKYCGSCIESGRLESIRRTFLSYENHEKPICFLGTQMVGRGDNAQIVEIAIIDRNGKTLLDTLVKPTSSITAKDSAIHGLFDSDVENAPSFAEIFEQVKAIYETHLVIMFFASFGNGKITRSAALHNIEFDAEQYSTACLYEDWGRLCRDESHRDIRIEIAALGDARRARSDCLQTRALYNYSLNQYVLNV